MKQLWVDTRSFDGGKLAFLVIFILFQGLKIGQSVAFVGTNWDEDMVHKTLTDSGYSCSLLHRRVENAERDSTMEAFRNGESNDIITS